MLVVPFALFLIYYGFLYLFPSLYARRAYGDADLKGSSFTASFSPERVRVAGKDQEWINEWASFKLIKESRRIFLFYDGHHDVHLCEAVFFD
jgi:hypothetical protein